MSKGHISGSPKNMKQNFRGLVPVTGEVPVVAVAASSMPVAASQNTHASDATDVRIACFVALFSRYVFLWFLCLCSVCCMLFSRYVLCVIALIATHFGICDTTLFVQMQPISELEHF